MGEGVKLKRYRKYLQYNDLVFDGYEMLGEYDASNTSFKVTTHDLSFGHGSYAPFKREYSFAEEGNVSLTLWLKEKKLPCEKRQFYRSFVVQELMKHGRLWAIQDDTIVWAYATVTNYSEMVEHYNGKVGIDVDFLLYEGIWHKADKQKTFLLPYDICTFMECYDFQRYQPCRDGDARTDCYCADCDTPDNDRFCCDCDCDKLEKTMALCYHLSDLSGFYDYCKNYGYRFKYDCEAAERFFGMLGQKLCVYNCNNGVIAGKIYSETDIPTTDINITLVGKMSNPYIEINGNGNYLAGDYDGTLVIKSNGDVYYQNCVPCDPLSPDIWQIPKGMTYGWTVKPRNNRVLINLGACCGKACAYFDIDNITV